MSWLARRRCRRKGHDWLLDHADANALVSGHRRRSEFIPIRDICLRCGVQDVSLPWGQCLGEHPLAEHYDPEGNPIEHPSCPGPQ